jgi:hypothetical protein
LFVVIEKLVLIALGCHGMGGLTAVWLLSELVFGMVSYFVILVHWPNLLSTHLVQHEK